VIGLLRRGFQPYFFDAFSKETLVSTKQLSETHPSGAAGNAAHALAYEKQVKEQHKFWWPVAATP
jgi:hypothetical protein